ncbi:putative glycerol kinase 5 [Lamellibrachia satsuma]|nr:putative glycerol kinase 5 [Lamellibrachia satsuma]
MFGQCCYDTGEVKCTLGGGAFITCNTGRTPHASVAGLYPLIGWKIKSEVVYVAEGNGGDCGLMIEWAKSLGLFDDVKELTNIAHSVPDSDGLSFVSAFSGLQVPVRDARAATLLIGLTRTTSKSHILRAVLESLAFRLKLLYDTMRRETPVPLSKLLRCDGGVSSNDFVLQLFSDLADCHLERSTHVDTTSLGVAFLAGLAAGVWDDTTQLRTLQGSHTSFMPCQDTRVRYQSVLANWQRAVQRSRNWHS